jgi:hypothetical protein
LAKKYIVTLTADERTQLHQLISTGRAAAKKLAHARVLLAVDEAEGGQGRTDEQAAEVLCLCVRTIERVRKRFVEEGFEAALVPATSKRVYSRKFDGEQEARVIALACSTPPAGKRRWSLRLLAEKVVELQIADHTCHETVRQTLKKTRSSRT